MLTNCNRFTLFKALPNGSDIIDNKNYIIWGQNELSWKDFKGRKGSKNMMLQPLEAYHFQHQQNLQFSKKEKENWRAFAYFDKTISWCKRKTENGLSHEKYHFNIEKFLQGKVVTTYLEEKLN